MIEEQDLGESGAQSILIILSVQLFNAGEYTCRAENLVGTDEATAELIVHGELLVVYTPWILPDVKNVRVCFCLL